MSKQRDMFTGSKFTVKEVNKFERVWVITPVKFKDVYGMMDKVEG